MIKTAFFSSAFMFIAVFSVSAQVAGRDQLFYKVSNPAAIKELKHTMGILFNEVTLNAGSIERNAQLINLQLDINKKIIKLQDTELIEDDAPAIGHPEGYKGYVGNPVEWIEDLRKGVVLKKIFVVNNPEAASARLVFSGIEVKGNKEPLYLSLNGEKIVRPATRTAFPQAKQYTDLSWDQWYIVELPAEKLRKGNNELLMWTESEATSWRVLIAHEKEFKRGSLTRTSPNRSMKSRDGGKTWSDSRLGAMDAIDGEYAVRLSLDHYLPSGEYISPLIDMVNGDDPLKRSISNLKASLWPDIDEPAQTGARIFVRFGASPFIADTSWTSWAPLERGKEYSLADKRYVQWRAELSTNNPLVTPLIRGLRITAAWEDLSANKMAGVKAHVINNGSIIQPSYSFSYEDLLHPELKRFREDHKLDQIVKGATTEFEIMMRLLNWAYRVPLTTNAYSWNWNDATVTPVIAEETGMPVLNGPFFKNRRMVEMCLYPTQALLGALLSMGYQARYINIHSEGMSGHEVTEVWSNQFNKWIYLDPTIDTYYFDPETGIPYNLLELHNLLAEQMPHQETWQRPFVPDIGKEVVSRMKAKVGMRQGNNPFSILTSEGDNGGSWALETMGHFRIIRRNDFLSNPLPVPVCTGDTMWGWDGYLNWYDETFPKRGEYQRYTNRTSDFYQPLNQVKIFLVETEKPGVLKVETDTFTPGGFDTLLVSVNNGAWTSEARSAWNWNLQSGLNTISVRARNNRGVSGPVSSIQVTYNP